VGCVDLLDPPGCGDHGVVEVGGQEWYRVWGCGWWGWCSVGVVFVNLSAFSPGWEINHRGPGGRPSGLAKKIGVIWRSMGRTPSWSFRSGEGGEMWVGGQVGRPVVGSQ
jgi:hypothetical protein